MPTSPEELRYIEPALFRNVTGCVFAVEPNETSPLSLSFLPTIQSPLASRTAKHP